MRFANKTDYELKDGYWAKITRESLWSVLFQSRDPS